MDVLRSGGSDEGVSIVLMDIEGTTTPISYIKVRKYVLYHVFPIFIWWLVMKGCKIGFF